MELKRPLVPHEPPLLLLDAVREVDALRCIAQTRVDAQAWYADAQGAMPGWFGLELMAQTIAAFSGHHHQAQGGPPRMGYLLGTRQYRCDVPSFPAGTLLEIEVAMDYTDTFGLSAFSCEIRHGGASWARAMLKVFEAK